MEKKPGYLERLNKPQYEAVVHEGSPLLILAGAGSGKTNAITAKIAYLISEKKVYPSSILAVTFTNRAAREMEERVISILGRSSGINLNSPPMIRTFHSFGAWVLRRYGTSAGLENNFTIYDEDDMLTLLQSIRPGEAKKDLKPYISMISRAKDYCLTYNDDLSTVSFDPEFPEIYKKYQNKLDSTGCADFGDLILKPRILLKENTSLREKITRMFSTILVDEYQDSNVAQFELLKILAGNGESLTVVGDDDQSIYRFRGAEVKNILTFPETFKNTKIIKLEQNYRSTSNILDIAAAVVSNNTGRLGKKLWTEKTGGEKTVVAVFNSQQEEAEFCCSLLGDGNYSNTAILYRTNAQSLAFESIFSKLKIPYRLVGALRFFEREEVKDILAVISLFINPKDEVSFRRVVNKPPRGLGKTGVEKIVSFSDVNCGGDLVKACREGAKTLSGKAGKGAAIFAQIMEGIKSSFSESAEPEDNLSVFVKKCALVTGFAEYYREIDRSSGSQKILNIEELVNHAADYPASMDGLISFIENSELDRSSPASDNSSGVTLITMHNTKGLEFDRVIITGLEEGLFPGFRNMENIEDLEEERRILYVSITRARKMLYMTCCRSRRIWGKFNYFPPSRFLSEIPENLVTLRGFGNSSSGGTAFINEGDSVYSRDYGTGTVLEKWMSKGEPVVLVRFEGGRTAQFLLRYSSLKKIDPNITRNY
ncbi:MAG: UvrD-helicase domain-containing protein [Spirochaetia bacterium]|jgi:DNA helicase-2/ATP-dependent DNA helicase PcrA|nr:UvrD-helicase domain-containing protein [Spirochaetia bacterium]